MLCLHPNTEPRGCHKRGSDTPRGSSSGCFCLDHLPLPAPDRKLHEDRPLPGLFAALRPGPSTPPGTVKNSVMICRLTDPTGASVSPRDWTLTALVLEAVASQLQTRPSPSAVPGWGWANSFPLCQSPSVWLCQDGELGGRGCKAGGGRRGSLRPACFPSPPA